MTKDELKKMNVLSNDIDTYTKNAKQVKELISKIDYFSDKYLDEIKIWNDSASIDVFHFDITRLSKDAKTRIVKAIELEITSKLEELQKEFNSLKIIISTNKRKRH